MPHNRTSYVLSADPQLRPPGPNFVEEPSDTSRFFDAASWARPRDIKPNYDPSDLCRGNRLILPVEPVASPHAA